MEQSDLLTAEEAARLLRIATVTLAQWRARGHGPKYIRYSEGGTGPIYYRKADVEAFIDSRTIGGAGSPQIPRAA